MKKLLLVLLLIFVVSNASIFRWPDDCKKTETNPNPPHESVCYHQVAMSYALTGHKTEAIEYCGKIAGTISNIESLAYSEQGQMSRCYRDIAVIFASDGGEEICSYISSEADYEKSLCLKEVKAEQEKNKNTCSIGYILPFILFSSFFFRSLVH